MMYRAYMLLIALLTSMSLHALVIDESTAYRIVCAQSPDGTLCVGREHGSTCRLYHNPLYDGKCQDAIWHFKMEDKDRYTIKNAKTGEYITYDPVRIETECKGLSLTQSYAGEASLWRLEDAGDGYYYISTDYNGVVVNQNGTQNYWNMRVDGSYLVGTYSKSTSDNARFALIAGAGGMSPGNSEGDQYQVIDGGSDSYVIRQTGNRVTLVPTDYVEHVSIDANRITLRLSNGMEEVFEQCVSIGLNEYPDESEIPHFTTFKFNNKYNYQLPSDVEACDPSASAIDVSVAGIGKWLTASFQFSHDGAVAYIGEQLQESKITRQRYDVPLTYVIGYKTWRTLELRTYQATGQQGSDNEEIRIAYVPFGRQQTVTVDWLCDHPGGDYGVPRIDILLTDQPQAQWGDPAYNKGTTEYFWIGQRGKKTCENAEITIDGAGVFPDMAATPILIKGRGNSTWQDYYKSKNPYHFTFYEKQKPLGLPKGKHWVLLSNKQAGSMLTNAIGHRVADMMRVVAPCHVIPVELYINGSYRGSYNLCERVGFSNNSVDLDDETYAAMVELDTYGDEHYEHDSWYGIMTKVKEPGVDESDYQGPLTFSTIMRDWENMLAHLAAGDDVTPYVDVESVASFIAANEMIFNCEIKHAKSTFAYSANVTDGFSIEAGGDATPWVFGPLWDCDWGFGYQQSFSYFDVCSTDNYFDHLSDGDSGGAARRMWMAFMQQPAISQAYYYLWHRLVNHRLPELLDFCDEYYAYAGRSLEHNRQNETSSNDAYSDYAAQASRAKRWLEERARYVLAHATTWPLPESPVEPTPIYPDPDGPVHSTLSDTTTGCMAAPTSVDSYADDHRYHGNFDLLGRRVPRSTLDTKSMLPRIIIRKD